MRTGLYFGTCGWSYTGPEEYEWVGIFYPSRTEILQQYFSYFDMVEINTTFYGPPRESFVRSLLNEYDKSKFYTAKIPHYITHDHRLNLKSEAAGVLEAFYEVMRPFGDRLETLLIQLPPWHIDDMADLEEFFSELDSSYRYAIEFRHESWLKPQVWNLLEKYNIAHVIVDEPLLPINTRITTNFVYIRWHGHGLNPWYNYKYSIEELQAWSVRLRDLMGRSSLILALFNNHFYANSILNAFQIMEMLGIVEPHQLEKMNRMLKVQSSKQMTFDDF